MIRPAVTISLTPEARGGPFVFWNDLANSCAKASAYGFKAIEIFPRSAEELDLKLLEKLLKRHELKVAAIGTGAGWLLRKLSLTDPEQKIRKEAQKFVLRLASVAARFGAPAIVGSMQGRAEKVSREQALEWLGEGLAEVGGRAKKVGGRLLFEPLNRYETNLVNRVSDGAKLLQTSGAENVKLLCDFFHMNIEEKSIPEALRAVSDRIGHIHLADSNRQAMGFGHTPLAPLAKVLREIKYRGYVSAEILPLPDSEAAARQTMNAFRRHFSQNRHA